MRGNQLDMWPKVARKYLDAGDQGLEVSIPRAQRLQEALERTMRPGARPSDGEGRDGVANLPRD